MTIFPYGRLQTLAPGIHVLDGRWKRSPLGRRMTVVELGGDAIALHSSIELEEADLAIVEGLGRVALILVPNSLHGSDAPFYAARHPDAKVLVPRQVESALRAKLPRIDGVVDDGLPIGADVLQVFPLAGTRMGEILFYHVPSRTLVTTDIVFHLQAEDLRPVPRLLMRLNGAVDRFGPTRLAKKVFITDREAFSASLRPVLDLPTEHVIMSHGRVLVGGGAAQMRAAFSEFALPSEGSDPTHEAGAEEG